MTTFPVLPTPDLSVMEEMADLADSMKGVKEENIPKSDKVREASYKLRYAVGKIRGLSPSEFMEAIDKYVDAKIEAALEQRDWKTREKEIIDNLIKLGVIGLENTPEVRELISNSLMGSYSISVEEKE